MLEFLGTEVIEGRKRQDECSEREGKRPQAQKRRGKIGHSFEMNPGKIKKVYESEIGWLEYQSTHFPFGVPVGISGKAKCRSTAREAPAMKRNENAFLLFSSVIPICMAILKACQTASARKARATL